MPPATVRSWALGRSYDTQRGSKRWQPLIRAADRPGGRLSFANLVELHVLSAMRNRYVRVESIRSATDFIRRVMKTEHPLADVDTKTDYTDVYVEYLGRLMNASRKELALRPIVEAYLERIDRDEHGIASRLYPITRDDGLGARAILIDPTRRFGRPVLASAGVETSIIADRFMAGESLASLADDFDVDEPAIEDAFRFETRLRAA